MLVFAASQAAARLFYGASRALRLRPPLVFAAAAVARLAARSLARSTILFDGGDAREIARPLFEGGGARLRNEAVGDLRASSWAADAH